MADNTISNITESCSSDAASKLTLEQNIERLGAIVKTLESDEISLEDSFQAYKDGMDLVKKCNEQIDQVEKQVLLLKDNGETEDFD